MDNAQLNHLSKALATGADKGTFVLPKGRGIIA
jgi:histone H1/5